MDRPPEPPLLRTWVQYVAKVVKVMYGDGPSLDRFMMLRAELLPVLRFFTVERRYSGTTGCQNSIRRVSGH